MCALAEGRGRPAPLWETEHATLVLDRFGARRGHVLVISKRHVTSVTELGGPVFSHLQDLSFVLCQVLEQNLAPRRLFVASLGASCDLPMSFSHYHTHVIPVPESDERARPAEVFSWSQGVLVYDEQEASRLRDELHRAFSKAWQTFAPTRGWSSG